MDTTFPQKWGAIGLPARSPDLTPLDFSLWDYLTDRVYIDKPTIKDLKSRIRLEMRAISAEIINNSNRSFQDYCQETYGYHFEHLL
nr:unnamed protein product [Callosobruchus analis]